MEKTDSQIKKLDSILANSFYNVKEDIKAIAAKLEWLNNDVVSLQSREFDKQLDNQRELIINHQEDIEYLKEKVGELKGSAVLKDSYKKQMDDMKNLIARQNSIINEQHKIMQEISKRIMALEKEDIKRKDAAKKAAEKASKEKDKIRIGEVRFKTNKKGNPNGEFVEILGKGDLTGYTLSDVKKKHVFRFPKGFMLSGKARVYSGKGKNTKARLYFNRGTMIWNDDRDVAYLKDSKGNTISKVRVRQGRDIKRLK